MKRNTNKWKQSELTWQCFTLRVFRLLGYHFPTPFAHNLLQHKVRMVCGFDCHLENVSPIRQQHNIPAQFKGLLKRKVDDLLLASLGYDETILLGRMDPDWSFVDAVG